jgi:hypothetical protein
MFYLEMLYQCMIFLRHTGLWEQMWETIRLNLNLNLDLNKTRLSFQGCIDEKKLSKYMWNPIVLYMYKFLLSRNHLYRKLNKIIYL